MSLFSALVKTTVNLAAAPAEIAFNIMSAEERPFAKVLDKIKEESEG